MSGFIGTNGVSTGGLEGTVAGLEAYYNGNRANSGGNVDHYHIWNSYRSHGEVLKFLVGSTNGGSDLHFISGQYFFHFTMTFDYIGMDVGIHPKIWVRKTGVSSPGTVHSQYYGSSPTGTHGWQNPLTALVSCDTEFYLKISTRDSSDGHHVYSGPTYSKLLIQRFNTGSGVFGPI